MMYLRQWLLGIIACALLVSIVQQLTPEGSGQKLVRFAGGLLLMLSMLRPMAQVDPGALETGFGEYREAVSALELTLRGEQETALSAGIAQRTGAYIEDKAHALGLSVRAEVETELADSVPLPARVTLYGEENAELSELIARELGIAKEKQTWKKTG